MRGATWTWGLVALILAATAATAEPEPVMERRAVSAGLFKNGLAVMTEEIVVPGAGMYRLDDPPIPLHGTWWVVSDASVETTAIETEVEVPLPAGQLFAFQRSLAGRRVELLLRGEPVAISGTVASIESPRSEREWDRSYRRERYRYWFGSVDARPVVDVDSTLPSGFLVLERDDGITSFIDTSSIVRVDVAGGGFPEATTTVRRPALLFDVNPNRKGRVTIRLSYLTKGIAWAPSYKVDLTDPEELVVTQKAVVKNELTDLAGTEIVLISGYPNVTFGHVTSPLSPTTTWAAFFRQLDQRLEPAHAATLNVMTQQAVRIPDPGGDGTLPDAALGGEGLDLHYLPIGERDLGEGEALAVETGSGRVSYERIVDWVVPDTRRADGRHIGEHERQRDPGRSEDGPWDAVRFDNPLGYPMTTGAAMIVEDGRFRGQTMSTFTNPGGEVTLRITRALSITTRAVEHEEGGEREIVTVGGRTFRRVAVRGELMAQNHRAEAVTMVIRRRFSGELLEADRDPEVRRLEEGVYAVNRRNEFVWTLDIPAGDTVELTYRYQVLVYH
jgi:hypothetical protein